jgi:alkanesulfonate monooxygenase SsuD/methylene tetrahydromethanopterin reductase-like flavin-dependent oxidoreductase (luciferase family)
VKRGVLLPTFRSNAYDALETASRAASLGIEGVFAYDHLWPMGSPELPALAPFPVLAAVAQREQSLIVGPLVARIGLVSDDDMVERFRSLCLVAPGRVIGALGTGDRASEQENVAYGIAYDESAVRREHLASVASRLREFVPVWIGAGGVATNQVARSLGVELNLWDKAARDVALEATNGPVSWAGNPLDDLEAQLEALATAGASWAVFSPKVDLARLGSWQASTNN